MRRLGEKLREHALAESLVILVIAGWWYWSVVSPATSLPGPDAVLKRTIDLFIVRDLAFNPLVTTLRVFGSVAISLVLGLALALLAQRAPWLDDIIRDRILVVLNATPSIGWALIAVVWFSVSSTSVMFVQVMILLPFCMTNFMEGLRNLDGEVIEMANSFTRRRRRVAVKIAFPMLLPYFVAALRSAYGVCWKIALVAELFGARTGLGHLMLQAQAAADATTILATCFAIVLLFMLGEKLIINPLSRMLRADLAAR